MLDPQTSRFWQATILSGLMDAQALTACWNQISPEKREDPQHIDRRLARQAVQMNALTLWQAQQLLAGRTGGYKVDRYVLLDLIGQGGMGRVYLARDTRLNRRVALKILSPERISNPRAVARFQREARVGAQLQHENLVRIYDFGESNARHYLVMEYIEGKTIGNLISEQGPMPPAAAARLVRQIALGLEHVHRKGLIHRDVNPYNIMVTHDGTAKLADLGLAIDLADEDRVTRDGATVGTFDYVAPEQARNSHAADIRSDIYSLGCTLYHMIAGQVPFPGSSLPEKLLSHQALEPTPLSELSPGLPPGLAEIVQRMMKKSPDERYPTPMQVAQALEPYSEDYADANAGAGDDTSRPRRKQSAESAALTPRTDQAEVSLAFGPTIQPEVSLLPTAAARSESNSPSTAVTQPGAVGNVADDATALLTPDDSTDETEAATSFVFDLGPEPSLSEGLSRPKSRSPSDLSESAASDPAPARWPVHFQLLGVAAVAVTVIVLIAIVAIRGWLSNPPGRAGTDRSSDPNAGALPNSSRNAQSTTDRPGPILKAETAIVVRFEDGEVFPANSLLEAVNRAMGTSGWVELRTNGPLHLAKDQILPFGSGRGRLNIRAAAGVAPVIEVTLGGPEPFLNTGSAVVLELSGLTFEVRYPKPEGSSPAPATPPLIRAAGKTTQIDHCAFRVVDNPRLGNARAIYFNGGSLEVDRCWFQGFDQAIEINAVNRIPAHIQQTMIVPAPEPVPIRSQSPELHGWGVKLSTGSSTESPQSRLILDHCTFEGAGLLDLTGSPPLAPLQIDVKHCAVRADALLAWKPIQPGDPLTNQLHWQGAGNQYDILGRSWIVLSASQGTPALSINITDLESWLRVATTDKDAIPTKLEFLTEPSARSDSFQPRDFAIKTSGTPANKPGADPELVGPQGRR